VSSIFIFQEGEERIDFDEEVFSFGPLSPAGVGRLAGCLIWIPEVRDRAGELLEPHHFDREPDLALLWQLLRNHPGREFPPSARSSLVMRFMALCDEAVRSGTITPEQRRAFLTRREAGTSEPSRERPGVVDLIIDGADDRIHSIRSGLVLLTRFLIERLFEAESFKLMAQDQVDPSEVENLLRRHRPLWDRMNSWSIP